MHFNYLALALPLFLSFILIEYRYSIRKKKGYFRFAETVANLNVGMAERLTDLLTAGSFYFLYRYLFDHFRLATIPAHWASWVLLFFATDFIWYWYHRLAHEVNLFWAAHIVHHQSEDFNYSTSTRITVFQAGIRGSFWAILPVTGFPPEMITTFLLVHGAYPFFTHTQTIGKLGILEHFLVTPSHHRVHHASNEAYLDKNYGDILIIWDRIFGSFAREQEPPVFGIVKPLRSYNFLWQHFHQFLELAVAVRREAGLTAKIRLLAGRPSEIDPRIRPFLERKLLRRQPAPLPAGLKRYVFFQTAATVLLLFALLLLEHYLTRTQLLLASLFLLVSIINSGALLEQQRRIFYLELLRVLVLLLLLNNYYVNLYFAWACLSAYLLLLAFHRPLRNRYFALLFHPG